MPKKPTNIIEPINASFDNVVQKVSTHKSLEIAGYTSKTTQKVPKSGQLDLPIFHSDVHATTPQGIEMGVLENGIPYLSQRGLVAMAS